MKTAISVPDREAVVEPRLPSCTAPRRVAGASPEPGSGRGVLTRREPSAVTAALDEALEAAGAEDMHWVHATSRAMLSNAASGSQSKATSSGRHSRSRGVPQARIPAARRRRPGWTHSTPAVFRRLIVGALTQQPAPGGCARRSVLLASERTGLPRDSVANVSQIAAVDRSTADRADRPPLDAEAQPHPRRDRPGTWPRVGGAIRLRALRVPRPRSGAPRAGR